MTKRLSLIALVFISLFSGCGEDDPAYKCTECVETPEANAAYDNTGQGIYKGVLIGSSGTIKFDIANNGTAITAVLEIDDERVELTASGTYNVSTGFFGNFTGTMDGGAVSIQFTVSTAGVFTLGTVSIPGHTSVVFGIFKEKSNQLVQAFEGTYSGDDVGTFNMVLRRNENGSGVWYVISRRDADNADSFFQGEVSADGVMGGGGGNVIITGTLAADNVKGAWTNGAVNGSWRGKRTL
jgi:hypothetical protein